MRIKKKLLVTGLSLLMGASLASSFLFMDKGKSISVDADIADNKRTVALTDLISLSSNASFLENQQLSRENGVNETDVRVKPYFPTGSVIKADTPYKGSINATFKGDSSLTFKFPQMDATTWSTKNSHKNVNGHFFFTLTDVEDSNRFVRVMFNAKSATDTFVPTEYSMNTNTQIIAYYTTDGGTKYDYGGKMWTDYGFENNSFMHNILDFVKQDDGWYIGYNYNGGSPNSSGTNSTYSTIMYFGKLPADMFGEKGYKISFASEWSTGTEIAFKSILGKSLRSYNPADGVFAQGAVVGDDNWIKYGVTVSDTTNPGVRNEGAPVFIGNTEIDVTTLATEKLYYGDVELTDGTTVEIPQFSNVSQLITKNYQMDNMIISGAYVTPDNVGSINTSSVGATGTITFGENSYPYTIAEAIKPTITLDGEVPASGLTDTEITIPTATSDKDDSVEIAVTLNGETIATGTAFTPTVEGAYVVTYTAVDSHGVSNTATYTIEVLDGARNISYESLFTLNNATITDPMQIGFHRPLNGTGNNKNYDTRVPLNNNFWVYGSVITADGPYDGKINATFTGDASLQFKFPKTGTTTFSSAPNCKTYTGAFVFKIYDAKNSSNYITVDFGNTVNGTIGVYDKDANLVGKKVVMDIGFDNTTQQFNVLEVTWEGDNLCITSNYVNSNCFVYLAVIDTTAAAYADLATFKTNGYKISFESDYATGTDIAFRKISSESVVTGTRELATGKLCTNGTTAAEQNAWKGEGADYSDPLSFCENTTIMLPLSVAKILTYNGDILENNASVNLKENDDFSSFKEAFNYGGIILSSEKTATPVGSPNLSAGASGDISFEVGGNTYTYSYQIKPTIYITYVVDGVESQQETTKDTKITLSGSPSSTNSGTFIGWIYNGGLYKAGAEFTISSNVTFTAAYINFAMLNGASIRTQEPAGIRFITEINKDEYNALKELGAIQMGTLIIPTDTLGNKTLDLNTVDVMNLTSNGFLTATGRGILGTTAKDDCEYFSGAIVNLDKGNYTRYFSARSYITITYADDSATTLYSDYSAENNSRSLYDLSNTFVATNTGVQTFIDSVADITIGEGFSMTKANDKATYTLSNVSVEANEETTAPEEAFDYKGTITVNANIASIRLNGVMLKNNASVNITIDGVVYTISNVKVTAWDETSRTITFDAVDKAALAQYKDSTVLSVWFKTSGDLATPDHEDGSFNVDKGNNTGTYTLTSVTVEQADNTDSFNITVVISADVAVEKLSVQGITRDEWSGQTVNIGKAASTYRGPYAVTDVEIGELQNGKQTITFKMTKS